MSRGFSAVLLAGGQSTRMGRDKAFVEIEGVPLWKKQIETLRALAPREIFISGPPREQWSRFATIADETKNAGPLAGIVASLRKCESSHLIVLGVDLPRMNAIFLRALMDECGDAAGAVAKSEKFYEPLAAVYPKEVLPLAQRCLASGERALQMFVARAVAAGFLHEHNIAENERDLFFNVNTPDELRRL